MSRTRRTIIPAWSEIVPLIMWLIGVPIFTFGTYFTLLAVVKAIWPPYHESLFNRLAAVGIAVVLGPGLGALILVLALRIPKSESGWRSYWLKRGCCPWCRYPTQGLQDRRCPECGEKWTMSEIAGRETDGDGII